MGYIQDIQTEDISTITLQMADNTEEECAILSIFDVDDSVYMALFPFNKVKKDDEIVLLYRYEEHDDGTYSLEDILEDEEYDWVLEEFDALSDDQMYSDIIDHFMNSDENKEK